MDIKDINNFYFVGHPQGMRTVVEFEKYQIICDKIGKLNDSKNNHCPYIWDGQFLATYCKKRALDKMKEKECIFYVIPFPSVQNIEKLFCDLVFVMGNIKVWSNTSTPPSKYVEETLAYQEHISRFKTHKNPAGGCRRTLEADKGTSFIPYNSEEKRQPIDILPILKELIDDEVILNELLTCLKFTKKEEAKNKNAIRQTRIFLDKKKLGEKLYKKLFKNKLLADEVEKFRKNEENWNHVIKKSKCITDIT